MAPVWHRTEWAPVWHRTEWAAVWHRTECASVWHRTEWTPVWHRTEWTPVWHRTEWAPVWHRTEWAPVWHRTELAPVWHRTEWVPVWHRTECTVLESTRRVVIKGSKFNIKYFIDPRTGISVPVIKLFLSLCSSNVRMAFLIPGRQYERRHWKLLQLKKFHYKAIIIFGVRFMPCKRLVLFWGTK